MIKNIQRPANKGFTLLEVLLAVVLLVFGVIVVAGLFANAFIASSDAENTAIAMNLAQKRLEEVGNINYASIADESKAPVSDFSGFQRQVAVTEPLADLKQVTVTVYWTSKGSEASLPLVTYISKN